MQQDSYPWPHKDLLDVTQLSERDVFRLLDTARAFHEVNRRPVKKVPALKGRTVVLFFAEPSTRTRLSFDTAAKRLSADTFTISQSGSSIQKGETLRDTALTLQAMSPDAIVLRDASSGSSRFLAERLSCAVINAGDGWHAHPSQALLDLYSLREAWNGEFSGKTLLLLGDAAHSRVVRSNLHLLTRLGVRSRRCAPRTLLPAGVDSWPAEVYGRLEEAVRDVDAVMCLRLQLERQQAGLLPDLRDYSARYCLTSSLLALAKPGAHVLHPGPMNRGLEIAPEIADSPVSLLLNQVAAGVVVRMAILFLYVTRTDSGPASGAPA